MIVPFLPNPDFQPGTRIVTQSSLIRQLIEDAKRVARSSANVLITGESGTGKELFARIIHEFSLRRSQKYVNVNCAALPSNLIESELFGHEKGSFTDAIDKRIGRFEFADKGTLLLDEVTEIPMTTQAKLLRTLEENEIQRVGSNETLPVDVRVVATSNRDMLQCVEEERFRMDLFYRLNVIQLRVPSLRERPWDIPVLADHFLGEFKGENSIPVVGLTKKAIEVLKSYSWPGNVRELRNCIHRACVLTKRARIDVDCFQECSASTEKQKSSRNIENIPDHWTQMPLAETEKQIIMSAIARFGTQKAAARSLGITSRTISSKLKIYREDEVTNRAA